MIWLEIDQNIDVTVRAKILPYHGSEESQAADVVFLAKRLDLLGGQPDCIRDHGSIIA